MSRQNDRRSAEVYFACALRRRHQQMQCPRHDRANDKPCARRRHPDHRPVPGRIAHYWRRALFEDHIIARVRKPSLSSALVHRIFVAAFRLLFKEFDHCRNVRISAIFPVIKGVASSPKPVPKPPVTSAEGCTDHYRQWCRIVSASSTCLAFSGTR